MNTGNNVVPTEPPTLDADGNCTTCGLDAVLHIRKGDVLTPREAHRDDTPTGFYADEVAVA
jgi:hypothetical protein